MFLRAPWLGLALVVGPMVAHAERDTTREAMERLEEILALRQEDGRLDRADVLPTILVAAAPRYAASEGWFETRAISALTRAFGADGVRLCEACSVIRTRVEDGRIEQSSGPVGLDEVVALDERYRGTAERARTAIWLHETQSGVSLRIVDLRSGGVVFATNVDPDLYAQRRTARTYTLTAELERRARGESLTHAIVDLGVYPGQHIALEWADQWGDTNANLSGFVLSVIDPVLGVGASYHRVLPWLDLSIGVQVLISIPTAVAQGFVGDDIEIIDPALTAAGLLRIPIGSSNFAGLIAVSTNGAVGLGVSLLNTSLLPVLP